MTQEQTILVLGGGVGGLVTANTLRKLLPSQHRVVLVEREANHLFTPSLLWLMTGRRRAEQIRRPLERLRRKGIEVVRGEIERIEPEARRVKVGGQPLSGDHLVISLGAEFTPEAIPGLAEGGHTFCTLAGAERLRDALPAFRSGRLVVLTAAPAYKCPAAPYEAAMLLEHDCRRRGVRDSVQIDLYAAEPGPLGVAGPAVSAGVRRMVEQKGIAYHPEHQVTRVDPAARRIDFANGASASFDLLVYVPSHRASPVVREAGLLDESGYVPVERHTLATRHAGVYAIGDVTGIPLKLGKPLPKAGVFAHYQGEVVAHNIARAVTGRGRPARFDGSGECFIETGDHKAGFGKGNFYAEPTPRIALKPVGYRWHVGKVLFEKSWLWRWF
jgi:sulfide:quinone oxidoreductase